MLARKGTVLSICHGRSYELRRWERCWQEKLLPYELNTEIPIKLCLPQTGTTWLVSCETERVEMSSLCWAGLQVNTINYNTIRSCCIVFKHQNLGSFSPPPSLHVHNLNVADHTLCVMFVFASWEQEAEWAGGIQPDFGEKKVSCTELKKKKVLKKLFHDRYFTCNWAFHQMVELITKCLCFPINPLSGFLGNYGPSSPCQRNNVTAIVKLKTMPKVRLLCECCLNLARAGLLWKLLVNLDTPYTYTKLS